ncbi:SDR family NAD(P)-dependent oxidoreductase [Leisingera aquimarina]|uniref:SDR family NAD(P)-dependent oxidoreductase n=1 Tax=Leisingera aquimarina TaxID=476529 RepID=UPI0003F60CE0|nr:SDR family NAD(P)-dependent oxidoreductase [Leisingera aquimarina]
MAKQKRILTQYGPWAVVTGASSGIGKAIAAYLAAEGFDLILVARRGGHLSALAEQLLAQHKTDVRIVVADLATHAGVQSVQDAAADLEVGLLINNAGREDSGPFLSSSIDAALMTLDLNARAPLLLSHHFAQDMAKRSRGGIVFLSSIVAFQGVPLIANYAATKAYDLILSESLAAELEPAGIDVLAIAPGFTDTELSPDFEFSGTKFKPMAPEAVAAAIEAIGRHRLAVPGKGNSLLYHLSKRLMSRKAATRAFGNVFRTVLRNKLRHPSEEDAA